MWKNKSNPKRGGHEKIKKETKSTSDIGNIAVGNGSFTGNRRFSQLGLHMLQAFPVEQVS
jgi:hypothetical protein